MVFIGFTGRRPPGFANQMRGHRRGIIAVPVFRPICRARLAEFSLILCSSHRAASRCGCRVRVLLFVGGLFYVGSSALAATSCARGHTSTAPLITAADMAAIDRAVVFLPAVGTKAIVLDVGAIVPRAIETKPVPTIVRKVLPQYASYRAFRSGMTIVIVHPPTRRMVYLLPLRQGSYPAGCLK